MYTVDRNIIHEPTVENKHIKKECGKKIKETEAEIISKERKGERGHNRGICLRNRNYYVQVEEQ